MHPGMKNPRNMDRPKTPAPAKLSQAALVAVQ